MLVAGVGKRIKKRDDVVHLFFFHLVKVVSSVCGTSKGFLEQWCSLGPFSLADSPSANVPKGLKIFAWFSVFRRGKHLGRETGRESDKARAGVEE